jgi:glycosyltransferase involved in cell wall biosynthesis
MSASPPRGGNIKVLISIGVLAWNEEGEIGRTIASLFSQSVFTDPWTAGEGTRWEVMVVPNGCTDGTAAVSRQALERCVSACPGAEVSWAVRELEQPGKSNAWNQYIHALSSPEAELIIMIDADIEFGHPRTIENVLRTMWENAGADVVVDEPLKSIGRKPRKSFLERLSLRASQVRLSGPPGIAGSFYCARARLLRSIWMPIGLSGEDGFLRAMVVTNLFRSELDENRVVRALDASHYYVAETSIGGLIRHQTRMIIGTALNCFLTWDGLLFLTDPAGPGAGELIRNLSAKDPDWYRKYLHNVIMNKGWWVLPRGILFGRFRRLKWLTGLDKAKGALALCIGLIFDLPVMLIANHKIKSGKAIGYW